MHCVEVKSVFYRLPELFSRDFQLSIVGVIVVVVVLVFLSGSESIVETETFPVKITKLEDVIN